MFSFVVNIRSDGLPSSDSICGEKSIIKNGVDGQR